MKDGSSIQIEAGEIVRYNLPANSKTVLVSKDRLVPGAKQGL
jgi:hypothetical protein